jgi:hypothetical protein
MVLWILDTVFREVVEFRRAPIPCERNVVVGEPAGWRLAGTVHDSGSTKGRSREYGSDMLSLHIV